MSQYSMSEDLKQRKIDPIYNAIDSRNYKGAIKLCSKKDIQHWDITKALLAYSLVSMQKTAEALQVAREVKAMNPTDDSVLNALSWTFKAAKSEDEALDCYENALKVQPGNENLSIELFFCYVRRRDGKKQQQLAMKLYKNCNHSKYVFWAVASMLQQADISENILTLGEKMLRKILYEVNPSIKPGSEELQMFVEVLCRQGKHMEALEELDVLSRRNPSPTPINDDRDFTRDASAIMINDLHLSVLMSNLLEKGGKWEELLRLLTDSLGRHPDQWDMHKKAIFALVSMGSSNGSVNDVDSTGTGTGMSSMTMSMSMGEMVLRHRDFLKRLQVENKSIRGPHLAEIVLLQQWMTSSSSQLQQQLPEGWAPTAFPVGWEKAVAVASSESEDVTDVTAAGLELVRLIHAYCFRFIEKSCCFADLQPFIHHLHRSSPRSWTVLRELLLVHVEDVVVQCTRLSSTSSSTLTSTSEQQQQQPVPDESLVCRFVKLLQFGNQLAKDGSESGSSVVAVGGTTAESLVRLESRIIRFCSGKPNAGGGDGDGEGGSQKGGGGWTARDEMLLLLAAAHSRMFSSLVERQNPSHNTSTPSMTLPLTLTRGEVEAVTFVQAFRWALVCECGAMSNPSCFGFSIAALDPLRLMGAAEAAVSSFNKLGVKYVQTDSMSFLLYPALLEGSLAMEAVRSLRAVLLFHTNAARDTGDMVVRSFKYSNYMKGLELWRFVDRCQDSTQLALARAELPLVHIADSLHSHVSTSTYLKECRSGLRLEALETENWSRVGITDGELVRWRDNMDYDLLPSAGWEQTGDDKTFASTQRHNQYINRIRRGRVLQQILMSLMSAVDGGAVAALGSDPDPIELLAELEQVLLSKDTNSEVNLYSTLTSENRGSGGGESGSSVQWLQWSQHISCGFRDFETTLGQVIVSFFRISFRAKNIVRKASQHSDETDGTPGTGTAEGNEELNEFRAAMTILSKQLLGEGGKKESPWNRLPPPPPPPVTVSTNSLPGTATGTMGVAPLRPSWIQACASFRMTLGCWGPLVSAFLLNSEGVAGTGTGTGTGESSSGPKKSKKKGKKPSTASSVSGDGGVGVGVGGGVQVGGESAVVQCGRVLRETLDILRTLMGNVEKALSVILLDDKFTGESVSRFLSQWEERNEKCTDIVINNNNSTAAATGIDVISGEDDDGMRSARMSLADKIVSSQRLSCERLRDGLRDKLALLDQDLI